MAYKECDASSFFYKIWNEKHSKSEQTECVRNLVGTRWLTDSDLTYIANLINTTASNALCFVLQQPSAIFANEALQKKIEKISSGQEVMENVFIILNIARTDNGDTKIALEGPDNGCHWTLLFFHANSPNWYYGDSLGWPCPSNSQCLVEILKQVEKRCKSTFVSSNVRYLPLHNPSTTRNHHCNENCSFYPLQTCSSICGVTTATMAALLATDTSLWPSNTLVPQKIKWLQNPTIFADFLRQILMNWVITQKIEISKLYGLERELDNGSQCEERNPCSNEDYNELITEGNGISGVATQDQEDSDSDPNSVDHHCSNEDSKDSGHACPTPFW